MTYVYKQVDLHEEYYVQYDVYLADINEVLQTKGMSLYTVNGLNI